MRGYRRVCSAKSRRMNSRNRLIKAIRQTEHPTLKQVFRAEVPLKARYASRPAPPASQLLVAHAARTASTALRARPPPTQGEATRPSRGAARRQVLQIRRAVYRTTP